MLNLSKKKCLVMIVLLLITLLMPLSAETDGERAERYAKEIANLQLTKQELTFKLYEKDIELKGKDLIIQTKDDIIKNKENELIWNRIIIISIFVAITLRSI